MKPEHFLWLGVALMCLVMLTGCGVTSEEDETDRAEQTLKSCLRNAERELKGAPVEARVEALRFCYDKAGY